MKRRNKIIKISAILLTVIIITMIIVNYVIASMVINDMADVRIEKNEYTLEEFGLTGEQFTVTSKDELKINAYLVPNDNAKGIVIILHGMHGMDATSLFDYAKFIYDCGYTPVVIDMRAHGKSEGDSLSFGYLEVNDVVAVIDYLKTIEEYKEEKIILYGLSMGGSTAINTAAFSDDVDAVIAVSSFSSYQQQVYDYMVGGGAPKLYVKTFIPFVNMYLGYKFNVSPVKGRPIEKVKDLDIPILFIHGEADIQTKYSHSRELFEKCTSVGKDLWIVEDKGHLIVDDILAESSLYYQDVITSFFDRIDNQD